MKINDYSPRTGAIESYLTGFNLIGAEIGVDAGAHCHSLLLYCSIQKLYLIDPWLNPWVEGFCNGRLSKWKNRICFEKGTSLMAVKNFHANTLDFIYCDQQHDYTTVSEDLRIWWPILKPGGILALRNYNGNEGLKRAADEFCKGKRFEVENYTNEILFFK